jgi:hypothetical protein
VVSRRLKVGSGLFAVGFVLFSIGASRLDTLAVISATSPRFWCNAACFMREGLELIGVILGIILMLAGGIALVEFLLPRDRKE